jgi:hypothetical protein
MTEEHDIEEALLHLAFDQGQIQALEWVLSNCSGGGNWRRKCEQKIAELKDS